MKVNPNELNRKDAYFFGISLITPRPIAFVTSLNEEGMVNAAPFSYFNGIFTKPFLFTLSIAQKKAGNKDSLNNILQQKEFCVNFVDRAMAEGVTISAAEFQPDISEMDFNGFDLIDAETIKTPRIKQSKASMECSLVRTIDDLGAFTLVIAEAHLIHLDDEIVDEKGYIKAKEADFLGRMGGADFCSLGEIITVPRKTPEEYMKG